jgi:hypothetical protein
MWLIEPSDILKVGILSLAFLSGFWGLYQWILDMGIEWRKGNERMKRATIAAISFWIIATILQDETSSEPHVSLHVSIFFLCALFFLLVLFPPNINGLQFRSLYGVATLFFAFFILIGNVVGTYVRDLGGFSQSVWTKEEQFQDVVIILATSHHTALLTKSHDVIVLPTANITKIKDLGEK